MASPDPHGLAGLEGMLAPVLDRLVRQVAKQVVDLVLPELEAALARPPSPVMTPDDAAAYMQLPKSTIYRLVKRELLPATRMGNLLRLQIKDMDKLLREGVPSLSGGGSATLDGAKDTNSPEEEPSPNSHATKQQASTPARPSSEVGVLGSSPTVGGGGVCQEEGT